MAYAGPVAFPVIEGGTGDSSFTAYAPVCGGTSTTGALQSAGTGISTSGFVLTSNGASALPSFQSTAGMGGNLVLISSQTASNSASISFTSGITATYNNYLLLFSHIVAATTTADLLLVYSTNGGSSYQTVYVGGINWFSSVGAGGWGNDNSTTSLLLVTNAQPTFGSLSGAVNLFDTTIGVSGTIPGIQGFGCAQATGLYTSISSGKCSGASATAVNAIKLSFSSGNITSGTITLFGYLE